MKKSLIALTFCTAVASASAQQGGAQPADPHAGHSPSPAKPARAAAEEDRDLLGRRGKPHFLNPMLRKGFKGGLGSRSGSQPQDKPLFQDDFQQGHIAAWTPTEGSWGLRAPEGVNKVFRSDSSDASTVLAGHEAWQDYAVETQVVMEGSSGEAGLLGRVQGQGGHHYYELALGKDAAGRKSWLIRQRHHDHLVTLASGRFEYQAGKVYTLRFDLRGKRLRGFIAEPGAEAFRPLGEAEDGTWSQGGIGLRSEGAPTQFDAVSVAGVMAAAVTGPWGPNMTLRDITGTFPGAPDGGWWVTPIHATVLPASGKVLITGWSRFDAVSCVRGSGSRKNGTSFILDPALLTPEIERTHFIQPIDEQNLQVTGKLDVLYCAGHNTMADGRILFTGGSRYTNLGGAEVEDGLNYSRIYDPAANSFARITPTMLGGPVGNIGVKWYPTNLLLPDGNTLTTGGFKQCCQTPDDWNLSVELFRVGEHMAGRNPWSVLVQHEQGNLDMPPTRGYTNLFLLPTPVSASSGNGFARPIVMFAGAGKALLFSDAAGLTPAQRFHARSRAVVPSPAAVEKGEGASGALISDGRIALLGGSADSLTAQRMHLYNPHTDIWSQFNTGIARHFGNNVLLPDGTLLAINGYKLAKFVGDVRRPQIIDPLTQAVTTLDPWENDVLERGYHSFAVLLKDGRILIGGGTAAGYSVGCERADARVFSPPYLAAGARPVPTNIADGMEMTVGGPAITVTYTGGTVRGTRGAALMAPGSATHAFDMGQRYVPLAQSSPAPGILALTPPPNTSVAQPGDYMLFLVSTTSTPSVGIHVKVKPPSLPVPWVNGDIGAVGQPGSAVHASGKFTVRASGADIWGTSDQFHFVRRPINGDGSITARITGLINTHSSAKAAVMIRENTATGSRHAMMAIMAAAGMGFQRRVATGGVSTHTGSATNGRTWVRLTRAGNVFTAFASADGVAWSAIGSQTITMASSALVGLALTSHNNAATTQADFQNITVVE